MEYRVISIGTLSVHELWSRQTESRTPHATTTLVQSENRNILVDPGLPAQVIAAKLSERSGLRPEDISDVFLTNFRPAHRWGLAAFPNARWLINEQEREMMGRSLLDQFQQEEDTDRQALLKQEITILKQCRAADDSLAAQVDIFPLPGYTPGTCGLILSLSGSTVVIAGDAVPTREHLERGRILRNAYDLDQAQQSLLEVIEIADIVVPGHDNVVLNPLRR